MKAIVEETEGDTKWQNNLFDPPTVSWNIVMKDNSPALNIKPEKSTCVIYLRTMPEVDVQPLIDRTLECAKTNGLEISVKKFADPFYVASSADFVTESLKLAERDVAKTVSYGTDGGIFTELEDKIVFGPGDIKQAHTAEEWISLEQLEAGVNVYEKMVRFWCCQ